MLSFRTRSLASSCPLAMAAVVIRSLWRRLSPWFVLWVAILPGTVDRIGSVNLLARKKLTGTLKASRHPQSTQLLTRSNQTRRSSAAPRGYQRLGLNSLRESVCPVLFRALESIYSRPRRYLARVRHKPSPPRNLTRAEQDQERDSELSISRLNPGAATTLAKQSFSTVLRLALSHWTDTHRSELE